MQAKSFKVKAVRGKILIEACDEIKRIIVVAVIHKVRVTIIVGKSNHFNTKISIKVNLLDKE